MSQERDNNLAKVQILTALRVYVNVIPFAQNAQITGIYRELFELWLYSNPSNLDSLSEYSLINLCLNSEIQNEQFKDWGDITHMQIEYIMDSKERFLISEDDHPWNYTLPLLIEPRQANLVLIAYASSEGSGKPAHPRSLARTSAARSYKQWVKRNLQTESQIPSPSEWLGMHSYNLSWWNARRHKFAWRGSIESRYTIKPRILKELIKYSVSRQGLHPIERKYLTTCLECPRSLRLLSRDTLRRHFKTNQIHKYMSVSNVPKKLKDFILLKTVLPTLKYNERSLIFWCSWLRTGTVIDYRVSYIWIYLFLSNKCEKFKRIP